ncbi:ectonucleoside triphosphate diphosphohydrolase 5 [Oryzias melastigma]|uniref:nucleoside diphosphate phosphatase n=1 Tax=Oryzias melastigma TaxID=30732 RepID=A0A3B3DV33_ORYME|nr:ectonucleoside triphosphate diphosphohydrolase 5 [Oryzias melastigma]XP_036066444.1 ectonucleoside triphosphate diphosphohydrolase 5 [Oryzias melastigma]
MKPAAAATPLLLLVLLAAAGQNRAQFGSSLLDLSSILPALSRPANHSRIFHAVMFDAGSTGTRIHVYTFIQGDSELLPVLDNEMFHSVKPGLSAYADTPEMAGHTVRMLLKVAKKTVPRLDWKRTPLVLRATAGLRLLPADRAQALLDQVQLVFDESPFLVPDDAVSIMNGTDEGILAWVSLNFLTGHLKPQTQKTVGILDLGGGSTQITFLPTVRKTIENAPAADHVARLDFLNTTFELYSHSYLGSGIMAARLSTLGALSTDELEWRVFRSSCLPSKFRGEWSFGGLTYQVSGDPDGQEGYKPCYQEVLKVVKGIIHQPDQLENSNAFYAFSYYFDRAVDAGLIDGVKGGAVQVRDFRKRAKEVCSSMTKSPPSSPFLCMDLTYITCLLKDGFGFKESAVLQLTKKVNKVEASWALGATLDRFLKLRIH